MDKVETLENVAGAWQNKATAWDKILQRGNPLQAQLIFTSRKEILNAEDVLQSRILSKFGIESILLTRACLESNGFSGCETGLDQDGKFEHYKSVPHGWEWYEMGFFIHWTPPYSTTILCIDLPAQLKSSLNLALRLSADKTDFSDPYSVFSVVLFELLSLYDSSVWSIRDHICDLEAIRPQEPDYPYLHEIARHAIHVSETLMVASQSIQDIQQQQLAFMSTQSQGNRHWNKIQNRFQFQLRLVQGFFSRSESNKARIQNEITLAFNTAAQQSSKIQVRIGEEAKKETSAMKVIAIVTVTFLPATFVSSVFSMSFFHFEPAQSGMKESFTVSNQFWMYWILAAPLSLVVLGLWAFWDGTTGRSAVLQQRTFDNFDIEL